MENKACANLITNDGELNIYLVVWKKKGFLVGSRNGKPVEISPQMPLPKHLKAVMDAVRSAAKEGRILGKVKWIMYKEWFRFDGIPEIDPNFFEYGGNTDFLDEEIVESLRRKG